MTVLTITRYGFIYNIDDELYNLKPWSHKCILRLTDVSMDICVSVDVCVWVFACVFLSHCVYASICSFEMTVHTYPFDVFFFLLCYPCCRQNYKVRIWKLEIYVTKKRRELSNERCICCMRLCWNIMPELRDFDPVCCCVQFV